MAIPPTSFTTLLAGEKTPAEMYETLKRERFLSQQGWQNPQDVIAFISHQQAAAEARYNTNDHYCGPSPIDDVAQALVISPYLNAKGRHQHLPEAQRKTFFQLKWEAMQTLSERLMRSGDRS